MQRARVALAPAGGQAQLHPAAVGRQRRQRLVGCAACMAQQHRQPQREQLPDQVGLGQRGLDLAQPAAVAQHQIGQPALLRLREARRVHMRDQVGAVAVVIVVRDHHADLVQRRRPAQLALQVQLGARLDLAVQALGRVLHAAGLHRVGAKALLQLGHRVVAQIVVGRIAVGGQALLQIEDHALAQRPACGLQRLDAELRRQRRQDGQAAAQHRAAFRLQAGQLQRVDAPGLHAGANAPGQALGRDRAVADAGGGQDLRDRAGRARRAQRLAPVAAREGLQRLLELGAGGDLRGAEALLGEQAVAEIAHRQADAADAEGLGLHRHAARADDQLGRASADVDHQPRVHRGLQPRHALVDQPRFLAAGDHLDRMAERLGRAGQEGVAVGGLAQRLRRHRAQLARRNAGQPGAEALQADQAALRGLLAQATLGIQAGAEPHRLLEIVDAAVAAAGGLADLEAEAVRADVDRGENAAPGRHGGRGGLGWHA